MSSSIEICSQALLQLGDEGLISFETGNGPLCNELFPQLKDRVLFSYPWRFNTLKGAALSRLTTTPPTVYKYAYALPSDCKTGLVRQAYDSSNSIGSYQDFQLYERQLLTSSEQIYIDYQVEKDVEDAPPHVVNLLILGMKAKLAFAITDQQSTADSAYVEAWGLPNEGGQGGYFREAKRIDSQGSPPPDIDNFPLVDVRGG